MKKITEKIKKKSKELKIKRVKVQKQELEEAIYIDFMTSQIAESKAKLDEETENAMYELKKRTINKIFELEKEAMYDDERHKKIEEYVIAEMLLDPVLQPKLDNLILNGKGRYAEIARSLVEKQKNAVNRVTTQGYIEYYWDWNMKACKEIRLTTVNFVHFMDDTKEIFLLDHPAKLKNGKPVYICLRGIPFAIPMDFRIIDLAEQLKGMRDINPRFVFSRATLTSHDLYAKFQSLIVFRIFTPPKLTWKGFGLHLLSMGAGALVMWTFTSPYIFAGG